MQQLTLEEPGRVVWQEVPELRLQGGGDALVRPLAIALCDLDLPIIRGEVPIPGPIALGHEFVGEVVATGDQVASVAKGDRAIVPFQISCGECARCRKGLTANCTAIQPGSMYGFGAFGGGWGGALSDLVRVPFADAMLVPVPDGVSAAAIASSSDNIPDAWRTVAPQLAREPGGEVLVLGGKARSICLYAVEIAIALGSERVTYIDTDSERLALAEDLGAEPVEGPPPRKHGSHATTVDGSGTHEGLACALRSTAPGGWSTCVSIFFEPETPIPLLEMYTRGVNFSTGRVQARPAIPEVLELVSSGAIHPERVTSKLVEWQDAADAVLEETTKLVITRDS